VKFRLCTCRAHTKEKQSQGSLKTGGDADAEMSTTTPTTPGQNVPTVASQKERPTTKMHVVYMDSCE